MKRFLTVPALNAVAASTQNQAFNAVFRLKSAMGVAALPQPGEAWVAEPSNAGSLFILRSSSCGGQDGGRTARTSQPFQAMEGSAARILGGGEDASRK